jgi:nucleolar pre-ribosomal-associated protein 1
MATWGFAAQSNNESLLSAIPAVLAQLFKILSTKLDYAEYLLRLGRTLLQKKQLELFARGTATNKTKDFVISPALRLLREVAIFDGGALAKQVFRARDLSLKGLARNLGLRYTGEGVEDRKKPSVRTNAQRLLLSLVKFLPAEPKKELLRQRDVISAATRDINRDPPFLIVEFLDTMRTSVLQDEALQRDAKAKLLNTVNLGRIVQLYGYEEDEVSQGKKPVEVLVHEFLVMACTNGSMGLLNRQAGFYPKDINADDAGGHVGNDKFIDLGLDSLDWADRYKDKVPVRNMVLSEFIQTLRPWSSTKQSDLLIAIFKAAPELVADYFFRKKTFTFDPKLTATWIGYSAFLFSTLQLPVPAFFGHQERYGRCPPPTSIVIESILPQPLNQKVLTKCLGQKSTLIAFFAVRILTVAFQKLQEILIGYRNASQVSPLWTEAAGKLVDEFCRRCPAMKDVIGTFRKIDQKNILQRQATSKLLVMYYEVVPQIALESKFDVSSSLSEAMQLLQENTVEPKDRAMRVMEAENLFHIAHCSPGMRWFNKAEGLSISPFTAILRLSVEVSSEIPLLKLRDILDSLVKENGILQSQTTLSSVDALVVALRASTTGGGAEDIFDFVDSCALRCATTPIKYIDAFEKEYFSVVSKKETAKIQNVPASILLFVFAEQWPFVLKSGKAEKIDAIARFIAHYIAVSLKILEDKRLVKVVKELMSAEASEYPSAQKVIDRSKKLIDSLDVSARPQETGLLSQKIADPKARDEERKLAVEASLANAPLPALDDHRPLSRWTNKEVDSLVEDNHISALIMLLSSSTLSARLESLTALTKISHKLKESTYPEKDQIWILLNELCETARPSLTSSPLPSPITAFASHAIKVLQNPLNVLYPKLNHFLTLGPTWDLDKLPLMHSVISHPPTLDDARGKELSWLFTYLLASLLTPADLKIFYKRRVFEKLMALYENVYLSKELKQEIMRILYRAMTIEGGAETLLTRFGALSWLECVRAKGGEGGLAARVLLEKLVEDLKEDRLARWTGRTKEDILGGEASV